MTTMKATAATIALSVLSPALATGDSAPQVSVDFDAKGVYTVSVNSKAWYTSPAAGPELCVAGKRSAATVLGSPKSASGSDKFGAWTGKTVSYSLDGKTSVLDLTFQHYPATPNIAVGTASFPAGLNTAGCGTNEQLSTAFPSFDTSAAEAPNLHTLSWRGGVISTTAAAKGLGNLGANGLDCGPVVSSDPDTGTSLVWSTLNAHKIVPQQTQQGVYAMGLAAAIPSIPANYNYSAAFTAVQGGATAATYDWGARLQKFYGTTRLPSVTLSDIGYYTDDGAYYYVWGGAKELHDPELSAWIPPRPWSAEVGLVKVKEALYDSGVPVAYMQLDDWWYQGKFFFGNVKAVTVWDVPPNSTGLFPSGLPAFSDKLDLPLQLYTPFFWDNYQTKYNMSESTSFKGTKIVTPDDSKGFHEELFDQGLKITNGRFNTYEIDFLDSNFQGCAACMDGVYSADKYYAGMADAALARNISIQYCLPSATDMLVSLKYPAVIQARASGDYARPEGNMQPWDNVKKLGGSSLLLGALAMAPSKDTLWTASPQPNTSSDRTHSGYHTQPHVDLDSILATVSMGPVGISDALNYTDVGLISQAFRSPTDSTLLRPSRPLSTVDSVFTNTSLGVAAQDIRSTHAALDGPGPVSHYVLAWMTDDAAHLQPSDLYPTPSSTVRLATRQHVVDPSKQMDGCEDGKAASPGCVTILDAGEMPTIAPVGAVITNFSYTVVYEPLSNGAYFLGELSKFVHVSPQRFDFVKLGTANSDDAVAASGGPCGFTVRVRGSEGEQIQLVGVDPKGTTHVKTATIPKGAATVDVGF